MVGTAYYFRNIGCTWVVLAGVCIFFAGIAALYYTRRHPRLFVSHHSFNNQEHGVTKIVPLTKEVVLEQKNV
jgi:hypothetical protein